MIMMMMMIIMIIIVIIIVFNFRTGKEEPSASLPKGIKKAL